MFTGNTQPPLVYTPDFERENRLQALYTLIEKKITFFSLSKTELEKLNTVVTDIEAACILGFDSETLNTELPEDIYNFCRAIEEKYSPQLTHYKAWQNNALKALKISEAKDVLKLISGLSENNSGEVVSDDLNDITNCFNYIENTHSNAVFTQSWVLRLAMQILQPFKNQASSYPALVQSAYLATNKKMLNGIVGINLEVLRTKKEYEEQLKSVLQSATKLSSMDLTPLLALGYDCMEAALQRVDNSLRNIYRSKIEYSKKDARIRNLLNFLYNQGISYLEPLKAELNERQLQIVKHLFAKRYLGTKELSLNFRCDRKTIQRDFTKLLSSEVARSTGNGSALKYCINLKNNSYDMLEIHSTAVRFREDYQESLFGNEIWETIKKA